MALTTLANVKLILGITGTAQDAQITALINVASARIENWCNRKFEAKDCVEWYDGGRAVTVKRTPVNSILRVGIMDGSYFQVQYTGPDEWARVDVQAGQNGDVGKLRLTSSIAGSTIIPLTGLIDALLVSIGNVSGWSATFNGQPINGKAAWIPAMAGLDATLSPADIGNGAGPACIPVCMGELLLARYEPESGVIELTRDGQTFSIGAAYGASIGGISFAGMSLGGAYSWPSHADRELSFPKVYQGIVVDYNGGMGEIPADIEQTCIDMVQYMLQQASNSSMLLQSESLGGYAWTAPGGASGGKGGPSGGISGLLSGLDALMRERLAGYTRLPLSI